jgi:Flp pilus assembly protein TadG
MDNPATTSRRRRSGSNPGGRRRGAAAAELAIVLPLLATLVLGSVDFGRFAYYQIAVTNAARAGAGYAIMNPYNVGSPSAGSTWQTNILSTAQAELSGQIGSANAAHLAISPAPAVTADANGDGLNYVTVTATYPFTTIVNWQWTGLNIPHTLTLSSTIQMRMIR